MSRTRIALTLAALIAGSTAVASAHGDHPRRGARRDLIRKHVFERLDLSADQKAKVKERLAAARAAAEPLRDSLAEARKRLREVSQATPVNDAAIRAAVAEIARLRADLAVLRAHARSDVRALLTEEQRSRIETMRRAVRERIKERLEERLERLEERTDL